MYHLNYVSNLVKNKMKETGDLWPKENYKLISIYTNYAWSIF